MSETTAAGLPHDQATGWPGPGVTRWAASGWIYLIYALLVAAQTALAVGAREVWFSDEARYAAALVEMMRDHNWFTLTLNGVPYPDKPPVYFWLLAVIAAIGGNTGTWVFFAGSAISGWAYVCAGHFLVRRAAPSRPELALASALLLLGTPYVAALMHYSRMDMLFAAAIVAAMACLHTGLRRSSISGWVIAGFALMTLATFTKGPLGHALPLLALIADAVVARRLRRLIALDMALGILLSLAIAGAWFAGVVATLGWPFVKTVLDEQIFQRAVSAWHHKHPMWLYVPLLIAMWLPWTPLLGFAPIRQRIVAGARAILRRDANSTPLIYFALAWGSGFVFLSLLSGKIHIYLLPTLAPLAALTAAGLLGLTPRLRSLAWRIAAAILALIGTAALVEGIAHFAPFPIGGLIPFGLSLIVGAVAIVWFDGRDNAMRPLWINLAAITVAMNMLGLLIAPSLDAVLSTKTQAQLLRSYADRGYDVVAFATYDGVFTYYFGGIVPELDHAEELAAAMAKSERMVIVMRRSTYANLGTMVSSLPIIQEQRVAENINVILLYERGK